MNVTIGGIARTVEITSFDKLGDVKVCMLTTTADGSVGFQQLNQEVIDTIYASFPVDTAKGDIASFEDGADNVPVRKLTLNLVPYQGGSGDPAPDNVRPIYPANGKNLFSGTLVNGQIGSNGGYSSSTSRLTNVTASNVLGDFLKAGTYTISAQAVTSATSLTQCTVLTKDSSLNIIDNFAASWHDLPFTFTLSSDGYICFTLRPSTGNVTPSNYVAQVEHGSIATTYVPYNAIGISRCGRQLVNAYEGTTGAYIDLDGIIHSSSGWETSNLVPVTENASYTLSGLTLHPNTGVDNYLLYDGNRQLIGKKNVNAQNGYPTQFGSGVSFVRFCWNIADRATVFFAEGADTTYEPYQGERYYPISDNPVYGGTLEVETGVLTVTKRIVTLSGIPFGSVTLYQNNYNATNGVMSYRIGNTRLNTEGYASSDEAVRQAISDRFSVYNGVQGFWNCATPAVTIGKFSSVDGLIFNVHYTMLGLSAWTSDNTASVNALLASDFANTQFNLLLATPLVYQLTPVQVKTLLGYNNIWTDSGTVEVQYRANIGLYIQKIIGATEDDMIANQNISANKYFFVGEELYYSTSAISAGQTIVVGTNCIKTNLADALNALNS